jgi:ATP-dependent Lon protease
MCPDTSLLPMASVADLPTIPGELFAKFQTSFSSDPSAIPIKAFEHVVYS